MEQRFAITDVLRLTGLTETQLAELREAGVVERADGFDFRDVVVLRAVQQLCADGEPAAQVAAAIARVAATLPPERPLSAVRFRVNGNRLIASDGRWRRSVVLAAVRARRTRAETALDVQAALDQARALEQQDPIGALLVYEQLLSRADVPYEAAINAGRLLHLCGRFRAAERYYLRGRAQRPTCTTTAFNLAVLLEDQGRQDDALELYREVVVLDGAYADAHFNLSRLLELRGELQEALAHLQTYQQLVAERTS